MSANSPKHKFLEEFNAATQAVAGKDDGRMLGNVIVGIEPDGGVVATRDDEVYMGKIEALQPNNGDGTKALQAICDLADKHGVAIALHAIPTSDSGLMKSGLTSFYNKHQFQMYNSGQGLMWREPQPVAADAKKDVAAVAPAPAPAL